jgi:hypothetical protein
MYQDIPLFKREAAVSLLLSKITEQEKRVIMLAQMKDPTSWITPYHLTGGMWIRNQLRMNGMDEQYFEVDNLDCIQGPLWEDALWGIVKKGSNG